jgi:hypothetical protein
VGKWGIQGYVLIDDIVREPVLSKSVYQDVVISVLVLPKRYRRGVVMVEVYSVS